VALSWGAVTGATSYNIKRREAGGTASLIDSTSTTSYTDLGLANGTEYFYVVAAHNSAGDGPASAEVSATPTAPPVGDPPSPPTGLSANPGPGAKKISLSWTTPATGGVSSYNVLRSADSCGGSFATIATGVSSTNYNNTGLTSGRTYCYAVQSVGSTGLLSGPSGTASATVR
jgi:cellulose 1,4-beta-cellobiosidase